MEGNYQYQLQGLKRDKAVADHAVNGYKYDLLQRLSELEEIHEEVVEVKKIEDQPIVPKPKKSWFKILISTIT